MKQFLSKLFIPQESNNHRASLLSANAILFLLVVYLLNQSILKSLSIVKPGLLGYSSEITPERVLLLTNQEREKKHLVPLTLNDKLTASAQLKATDMITNSYWAHNSPEGYTPWKFIKQAGYKYSFAGENLAKDFYDTESVMDAWIHSPTHLENIISTNYKEIGIAVVKGQINNMNTTLVVQHFGAPVEGDSVQISQSTPQVVILNKNLPLLNPLQISKILSSIIFSLLIIALVIDGTVTLKENHLRFTGSTTGHIGFLFLLFILIMLTKQGVIN